jgi:hypothetical protein
MMTLQLLYGGVSVNTSLVFFGGPGPLSVAYTRTVRIHVTALLNQGRGMRTNLGQPKAASSSSPEGRKQSVCVAMMQPVAPSHGGAPDRMMSYLELAAEITLPSGILGLGPSFCCLRDAMCYLRVWRAGFVAEASAPWARASERNCARHDLALIDPQGLPRPSKLSHV